MDGDLFRVGGFLEGESLGSSSESALSLLSSSSSSFLNGSCNESLSAMEASLCDLRFAEEDGFGEIVGVMLERKFFMDELNLFVTLLCFGVRPLLDGVGGLVGFAGCTGSGLPGNVLPEWALWMFVTVLSLSPL